jgi:eukaryotic-like serine/threonine-protein kinase
MDAPSRAADRNLLFGILALQMDFISRDQLVAAMNTWVLAKSRPLGAILIEQQALGQTEHALLDALVEKHLERHGNDPEKSLAALNSAGSAREALERVADPDVQASLGQVSVASVATDHPHATPGHPPAGPSEDGDLYATRAGSVGASTSNLRFRFLRPHARGGLGQVSVALDEELHREVALKEIQEECADDPASRIRFLLEAEVTGRLEHPGIVPVYGLGQYEDGRPYYAMRLIRGDSLKEAIERFHRAESPGRDPGERSLGLRELLGRFIDVCNAIAYAHSRGVLHRDLKPSNIMLGKYGETLVLDWGLAKPIGHKEKSTANEEPTLRPSSASGSAETVAGSAVGTPQYMSPEQAAGRLDLLAPASDVYSLGATLYCLLTGQAPFTDADVGVVIQKVQRGESPPPRQVKRQVSPALEAVCLKAMALRPEDRYSSPRALADDIEHWLADEPVTAHRERMRKRVARWGRRHRTLVTAASVLLVTAVAALSTGLVLLGHKQAEVVEERNAAQKARGQAEAVSKFYEENVLAAARPGGWAGGAGKDVTLKQALDLAAKKIDKAFAGQPELEAAVRNTLGMTYWYLGEFKGANLHLEKAYAIRREILGKEHPDTLTSLHNLAMERWKQGQFKEAIELARQALERRQRVLGPADEQTLWTQLNLGLFLWEANRLDDAEVVLRQAIQSCKRSLGPDHHHTLYGQNDLACVLNTKGKFEEALALDRETLEGRRRSLGPNHPDTLRSLGNLAYSLEKVGKIEEAVALDRQSLEARRRVLGNDHTETLLALSNLAHDLVTLGEVEEGEALHREALEARRRVLGPEHPDTLYSEGNLGDTLRQKGQYPEAEQLLRHCLETRRRLLGDEHTTTLFSMNSLALLLQDQGKFKEAETLYRQTLEARRRVHGREHNWTLTTQNNLAALLGDQGKLREAEKLFQQVLTARRKTLRPDHLDLATTLAELGDLLAKNGKPAEAEVLVRECLTIREKKLPSGHWLIASARSVLGTCLARQKKFNEAEPLLLAGYDGLTRAKGTPARRITRALDQVIELYEKWSKPEQAEAWRKKRPLPKK